MNHADAPIQSFMDRNFRGLAGLIVLGIVVISGFLLLWPQYQRLQTSGVLQYRQTVEHLSRDRQYLNELQTMQTNFNNLDTKSLRLLNTIIPTEQSTARLFEELELAFNDYGFTVQSINLADLSASQLQVDGSVQNNTAEPADSRPESTGAAPVSESNFNSDLKNVTVTRVTINVIAPNMGYDHFKSMLAFLEQYERVINLETLSYTGASDRYTFVFNMYQQAE